jgi:hypothetical protein
MIQWDVALDQGVEANLARLQVDDREYSIVPVRFFGKGNGPRSIASRLWQKKMMYHSARQ